MPRVGPSLAERADYYNLGAAARQGLLLPRASARALEQVLLAEPEELRTRARLVGFYFGTRGRSKQERQEFSRGRRNHIMWFIRQIPECKFAGDIYFAGKTGTIANCHKRCFVFNRNRSGLWCELLKGVLKKDRGNAWAHHILWKVGRQPRDRIPELKVMPPARDSLDQLRQSAAEVNLDRDAFHGEKMPPRSAGTLERVLAAHPVDVAARALLLGFYNELEKRQSPQIRSRLYSGIP